MTDLLDGFGWQDRDDPVDGDIELSQSTVSSMDLCPARVGYSTHEGFDASPSEPMSFGTAEHATIEHDLWSIGTEHFGTWSRDDVRDLWNETLIAERDGSWTLADFDADEKIEQSIDELIHANKRWHQQVWPTLKALGSELLIEERVTKCLGVLPDGRHVWFGGTADLVDVKNKRIYDWKTSGREWKESKAAMTPQAQAYTWLYGIDDHTYWVYARNKRSWQSFRTHRRPEQVDAYLRHAWQRARQIGAGIFPATPLDSTFGDVKRAWYCSAKFCGAWDVCEFKYLPDDVYEAQIRDPKEGWQ